MGLVSSFSEEMVAGRGYIALAAVIFGKYKPRGVLVASVIFVAGNVLSNILQVSEIPIPYTLLSMIPYVLTIIALAVFARGAVAPASLGKPYKRG
jgi:simple sugar transport system permease protein